MEFANMSGLDALDEIFDTADARAVGAASEEPVADVDMADVVTAHGDFRRWRRRGGRREGLLCAAGGHSGYARCATPCRGAPFFAWTAQGGAAGAGDAVSARRVAGSGVPLIVQPQSERVVSAGTSARKNSWPLCLHARGLHTQTHAHASRCVTVEHASTGICVHHARVSWISKQPGVICPS